MVPKYLDDAVTGSRVPGASTHLALDSIEKWYGRTHALSGVSLSFSPSQVHAVIGENGSGKSTLLKVLSGEVQPDGGHVVVDGQPVKFRQPRDAIRAGVALIAQEVPLCETLTVAENISLGSLPARGRLVRWQACRRKAAEVLEQLGEEISVQREVATLSADERQVVAIARALAAGQGTLLLDEPTSSLSLDQANRLFGVIRRLRSAGIALVYVTQRLAELREVADQVSIIRDGLLVESFGAEFIDEATIAKLMIGRSLEGRSDTVTGSTRRVSNAAVLRVDELELLPKLHSATLTVDRGEVVGLAGLVGSGAAELLEAVAGLGSGTKGTATLRGAKVDMSSVRAAMAAGVGYLPRDRRREGLLMSLSVAENMQLSDLSSLWPPFVHPGRRRRTAAELAKRFSVKAASMEVPANSLSGGNQQKLIMARVLARAPHVLLLNEPTRGVDVGAKLDIFREIRAFADEGKGALMYSSEFKDLLEWCDRVVVLYRGRVVADGLASEFSEEDLIRLSSKGRSGEAARSGPLETEETHA